MNVFFCGHYEQSAKGTLFFELLSHSLKDQQIVYLYAKKTTKHKQFGYSAVWVSHHSRKLKIKQIYIWLISHLEFLHKKPTICLGTILSQNNCVNGEVATWKINGNIYLKWINLHSKELKLVIYELILLLDRFLALSFSLSHSFNNAFRFLH